MPPAERLFLPYPPTQSMTSVGFRALFILFLNFGRVVLSSFLFHSSIVRRVKQSPLHVSGCLVSSFQVGFAGHGSDNKLKGPPGIPKP